MQFLRKLGIEHQTARIDWDMTPVDTFSLFESRGGKERVRSTKERYYYFYIDNWLKPARLCFMERGIRHARVLARISAPQELINVCVASQGATLREHSYAIDRHLRLWIEKNILTPLDMSLVEVQSQTRNEGLTDSGLPAIDNVSASLPIQRFRRDPMILDESDIGPIARRYNFFESQYNQRGSSCSCLVDNKDNLTVTDLVTGLIWLRSGSDHGSKHRLLAWVSDINQQGQAGFQDWRLPTVEEGMSLLRSDRNIHGLYLDPCFTSEQGYIFTSDIRKPGGCWFIDWRQARVYWAGGTMAGGFCRPCRSGDAA
ncbi:MAG: hypothetical protein A2511_14985 [Deltaproteobacteria bacterium RIFOXYD12_FULL_50_9]|nr:MAG: hypothetical protein A2511_14985 [Deltaproteobacteria bacterium RIFOXYD12_FULL_50_9]